jgi:ABC-type multidrug transport system fused ATPase/permease subunit
MMGGPMGRMGMPTQKAKNFKASFGRLLRYLKPHRVNLIVVLIFAIASTTFTIAAPKVSSLAMNKLQDAYMSRKVIEKMNDAQYKAEKDMSTEMANAQSKAVEQIDSKMADAQNTAVDQIATKMSDAQVSAVDGIVSGFYTGMVTGQKAAVNQILTQMAAAQKSLVEQINAMMQQAQSDPNSTQTMDPALLASIQKLLALPEIDSLGSTDEKVQTTIEFISILQEMPAMPGQTSSMDPAQLEQAKSLLELPMIDSIKSSTEKVATIKKFVSLSGASLPFDEEAMDVIYSRIPKVKASSGSSGSGTSMGSMDSGEISAVEDLLKVPMISTISDPANRNEALIELIDAFSSMPGSSSSGMDTSSFDSIKKLLALPKIDTITDAAQKNEAVIQLIDVFKSMPDMSADSGSGTSGTTIDKSSLDTVKELLSLPLISSLTDEKQKTDTITQMLDIFEKMPSDMGTTSDSTTKFDKDSILAFKQFINLPKLDTLTDPVQKSDVVKQIMDLGKKMQSSSSAVSTGSDTSVKYTDAQVEQILTAIKETNGQYDFKYIGMIALILIAMYIISALFSVIMGLVMSGVAQKTSRDLRREVDDKLNRLPLKYYDSHPHGDILSRVTNDIDTIANTLQQSLTQIITSVISIIGYIIMMLTISPVLTLIVVATLPLYIVATAGIAKKSQKFFAKQQKEIGLLSGHVEEMYAGHKIVKAFGKEKDSIEEFENINTRLQNAGWKAQFVSGIMFPCMNFVSNLGYVGISIVGSLWITKGLLGLGDIIAFIQYSRSFTMPIVQTANIANIIQSTVACAERVFEVLDEEEEIPDKTEAVSLPQPRGEVRFEHVNFSYKPDEPLMDDMNLVAEPGHTVAIVGPTGAGKTTLINLLMRFYEINSGKISIDGVDVRDMKRSELRKMFGMVLQDTWLFNGTIKDNIAYGKEGATMEEIVEAAKAAHADHFIRTLPEGYNTVLNEEATNISQGQKQLLTIARAILADPTILILDEATSSVDTRTEVMIQKAMANLMHGRTSFVIAHRLSTIRDAELILVMNKGSVIEMGNHKQLLEQEGFYADLYNSQFSGADLGGEAV